jgi:exodeoxyribonuclease V gamma subunit
LIGGFWLLISVIYSCVTGCGFLLKQRLGHSLEDEVDVISESEPFQLDGLDRYHLHQALVDHQLQNLPTDDVRARYQAEGVLPPETVGKVCFNREQEDATRFVEAVSPYLQEEVLPPITIDLEVGGFRLQGSIQNLRPAGLIHHRFAKLKAKDRIGNWLEWLVLNLLLPETRSQQSILLGLNQKNGIQILTADAVQEPEDYLVELLTLYQEGLTRPLPFFPRASTAYVQGLTGKAPAKALLQAEKAWYGSELFSEKDDPYFNKCFGHKYPLDDEFTDISKAVLMPVFSHYSDNR